MRCVGVRRSMNGKLNKDMLITYEAYKPDLEGHDPKVLFVLREPGGLAGEESSAKRLEKNYGWFLLVSKQEKDVGILCDQDTDDKTIRNVKRGITRTRNRFEEMLKFHFGVKNQDEDPRVNLSRCHYANMRYDGNGPRMSEEYRKMTLGEKKKRIEDLLAYLTNCDTVFLIWDVFDAYCKECGIQNKEDGLPYNNKKSRTMKKMETLINGRRICFYSILHPSRSSEIKVPQQN